MTTTAAETRVDAYDIIVSLLLYYQQQQVSLSLSLRKKQQHHQQLCVPFVRAWVHVCGWLVGWVGGCGRVPTVCLLLVVRADIVKVTFCSFFFFLLLFYSFSYSMVFACNNNNSNNNRRWCSGGSIQPSVEYTDSSAVKDSSSSSGGGSAWWWRVARAKDVWLQLMMMRCDGMANHQQLTGGGTTLNTLTTGTWNSTICSQCSLLLLLLSSNGWF